jgi:hypothetical protein
LVTLRKSRSALPPLVPRRVDSERSGSSVIGMKG